MDRTKPCKAFARNYRKCQQQQKKTWKCFRVYKMLYKIMLFFGNSRKEERYYKLFFLPECHSIHFHVFCSICVLLHLWNSWHLIHIIHGRTQLTWHLLFTKHLLFCTWLTCIVCSNAIHRWTSQNLSTVREDIN